MTVRRLVLCALPTAAVIAALGGWLFHGSLFDDAYIAFRFSENWALGHGLRWNPGEPPVEGFTSFSWVFIGAALQWVSGLRPHQSMIAVAIVCWWLFMIVAVPMAVARVLRIDRADLPRESGIIGIATLVAILVNPYLVFNAFHGLETPLCVLAFTVTALLALGAPSPWRVAALAMASWLCVATRPDAAAFVGVLWLVLLCHPDLRSERRAWWSGAALGAGAVAAYLLIKMWWFGYPLPNTFYLVDQGDRHQGFVYVRRYVLLMLPLALFVCAAAAKSGRTLLRDRTFLLLALPAAAFCACYMVLNPKLGQGFRYLIPTLPLLFMAGLRACVLTLQSATMRALFVAALVALTAASGWSMARDYSELETFGRWVRTMPVPVGQSLAAARTLSPAPVLALADVGAIPYFSGLPTVDILGLADATITHEGLTHEYLMRRRPDLVILQGLYVKPVSADRPSNLLRAPAIAIEMDGGRFELDLDEYRDVVPAPSRAHTAEGSTFQVVTMPGFAADYTYVTNWDVLDNRFDAFVRRAYVHADVLSDLLKHVTLAPK